MSTGRQLNAAYAENQDIRRSNWLAFCARVQRRHKTYPEDTEHELGRAFGVDASRIHRALEEPLTE